MIAVLPVKTHQDFQSIPYECYYTLSIPIKHALQTRTHITHKKKQALLLFLELCLPSSSFRPWVPDLNLNKSLEPMSETPCKYFLHLKSSFQLPIYSQFILTHSRMQTTYNIILKCIIYTRYSFFRTQ